MRIRNWAKFQHYKHRNPPWIRFYKTLLDDPEWMMLSGDASKMLACCWLLASENDGELPSIDKIAWRLRMLPGNVAKLIGELSHWLEHDDSNMLAPCKQDATTETDNTETDNTETEARVSKRAPRSQGSRLPPNWKPSSKDLKWAFEKGYPDAWTEEQTEALQLWADANSNRAIARKADWSKTWRNWMLREWSKHRPNAALQVSPLMAACDRQLASIEAAADPFAELDIPPELRRIA